MCFMSMIINPSKLLAQKKKFVVNIEPLRSGLNNTVPPLRRNIRRSTIDPKIHFLIKIFFNFKFATLFFLRWQPPVRQKPIFDITREKKHCFLTKMLQFASAIFAKSRKQSWVIRYTNIFFLIGPQYQNETSKFRILD